MLATSLVITGALAAVALVLLFATQTQAKRQKDWRREKLKSIEAKKARIAARKHGQSDGES